MKTTTTFLMYLALVTGLQAQTQMGNDFNGVAAGDRCGYSTALSQDGNRMVLSSFANDDNGADAGHVRVFNWNGNNWTQFGNTIVGENAGDWAGISVDINGDGTTVAVGARNNDTNAPNAGAAYMFSFNGNSWIDLGGVYNIDADDLFGFDVALNETGTRIAMSAPNDDTFENDSGVVYVQDWMGSFWQAVGLPIYGEAGDDSSGYAIALNSIGNFLAIGAPLNDGNGTDSGHVRVYFLSQNNWSQIGQDLDGEAADDRFGNAVSLDASGNTLAVGGLRNDGNGVDSGHVRVFSLDSNNAIWVQKGNDIDGTSEGDNFGRSVALSDDGNVLVVGAHVSDAGGSESGQVQVFQWDGSNWNKMGSDLYGDAIGDEFGTSVSISGDAQTIFAGASRNDGNGSDAGQAKVFDISSILGTEEAPVENDLTMFPNPTQNEITFQFSEIKSSITITQWTIDGRKITSQFFENGNEVNYMVKGTPGLYIITAETGNTISSFRVVKN